MSQLERLYRIEQMLLNAPEVNRQLAEGYGVYFGGQMQTARLRFNAAAARWTRHDIWHPLQVMRELDDGALELSLP